MRGANRRALSLCLSVCLSLSLSLSFSDSVLLPPCRAGMLRAALLTPVFDDVARTLQLQDLDPAQPRRSSSASSPRTALRLAPVAATQRDTQRERHTQRQAEIAPPVPLDVDHHQQQVPELETARQSQRDTETERQSQRDRETEGQSQRDREPEGQSQRDWEPERLEPDQDGDGRARYDGAVQHAIAGETS